MSVQTHFFTDPQKISQNRDQSFGPVSTTEFRLTSKFSVTDPQKAFAICKGVILLQPQTGAENKVNLILRPFSQPFPGLNIKYFVYRGLQKSDFFTIDSAPKIIKPTSTTSDFINKINEDYETFNGNIKDAEGNTLPLPDFTAKYIGFDPLVSNKVLLSDFFFKESEFVEAGNTFDEKDAYELPMIAMGKSLGNFAAGECGIDVVLNYGDYQHNFDNGEFIFDLKYAREPEAILTVNGATDFEQKLQREQSTQFIDIAAFYGLFVPEYAVDVVSAGTKTNKRGAEVYNSIINKFYTKNNWYVYIQSERARSYDFYGNYTLGESAENLKTGLLEDSATKVVPMTAGTYGTFGWPILVNTQKQATSVATNSLYLQFATDNNNNTAFYGQIAKVANAQKDNFINADGLRLPPDETGNYSNLTATVQLTTPAVQGENIATLNILLYQGKLNTYNAGTTQDENGNPIILYGQANFFDNIFGLIDAKPLLKLNSSSEFSKITDEKLNLINAFYDKKQQGISIVQTITINDTIETGIGATPTLDRVTYLTETVDVMNNAVSATGSITPATRTSHSANGAITPNKTYELPEPYYYNLQLFTDSTQTITGLELKTLDGSTPTKIILGLTKTENDAIKALITDDTKNPRLFLIDLFEDENELISPENIKYQKYKVAIVAEDVKGKNKLSQPEEAVFVYSLDRRYHFSKAYSEYMTLISTGIEGDNLIDQQITI